MGDHFTLEQILRVEDSAELLAIRCRETKIPLWTIIRSPFLQLFLRDTLYGAPLETRRRTLNLPAAMAALGAVSKACLHNISKTSKLRPTDPVFIVATGARLIKRDGLFFNSLSDYFVSAAPDATLVLEDMFDWRWPFPRSYSNVLLHTPYKLEGIVHGRLKASRHTDEAHEIVNLLGTRTREFLDWTIPDEARSWLVKCVRFGAASLTPRYRRYCKLFEASGVRMLLKEEACYGGPDNAMAMLAAKQLGIVTAEYQHAMLSSGHYAYNFSAAVRTDSAYLRTLPEYLLTYGAYWGEQINAPVQMVAVGNPHRSTTVTGAALSDSARREVLVLGEGIETQAYLEFCTQLAGRLGGKYSVVFRPHPLERAGLQSSSASKATPFRIDVGPDIYDAFRAAEIVVAEASTGLFEAVGLVRRILVWDTPKSRVSLPDHPFLGFADLDELVRLVDLPSAGEVTTQASGQIWAQDWKANYQAFLDRTIRL